MAETNDFREVVKRVVNSALERNMVALRDEIVEGACAELEPLLQAAPQPVAPPFPSSGGPTAVLNAALSSILDSALQTDVLSALLAGAARFGARVALFVIRGGTAVGWRACGFADNEAVKSENLAIISGLMARVLQDRAPAAAAAAEFDAGFLRRFGAPAEGTNALVLPLLLRDKVAAIVYADAGHSGLLDTSALECLVRCTALWLEVVSLRKSHPAEAPGTITAKLAVAETPASPPPSTADEAAATAAPLPEPTAPTPPAEAHAAEPVVTAPAPAFAAAAAATSASAPAAEAPPLSPEEEEVHKKAKRFAKLLVEEIKLYNQAKAAEGRAQNNLYECLRDDIDKSRASYDRRYGHTCAASADYFTQELVRILCEGDESLLGEGFSR